MLLVLFALLFLLLLFHHLISMHLGIEHIDTMIIHDSRHASVHTHIIINGNCWYLNLFRVTYFQQRLWRFFLLNLDQSLFKWNTVRVALQVIERTKNSVLKKQKAKKNQKKQSLSTP